MYKFVVPAIAVLLIASLFATVAYTEEGKQPTSKVIVAPSGDSTVLMGDVSQGVWVLKQSADPTEPPVVMLAKVLDENEAREWLLHEPKRRLLRGCQLQLDKMTMDGTTRVNRAQTDLLKLKIDQLRAELSK